MKIKELDSKRKSNSKTIPEGKTMLSVQVDKEIGEELRRIAATEGVSKSALLRYLLEDFIKTYNKKK